ncbi:MAG: hypothetical protein A3G25_07495 [Betaproteobacteria bacterium RIFCSPLOWO2_12_FULL_63_13]|nr:MAG: hypothetical protein A3H32_07215 [Betaproteobacteria bacterium RIFCSPLOWO2_02_FULL_63_19]OGA43207.1 MAG: hypothetical protein A3G25_07495 [Betaproteobacteria bacterium RIFCSPLOWO2_12_FULL_63_13]
MERYLARFGAVYLFLRRGIDSRLRASISGLKIAAEGFIEEMVPRGFVPGSRFLRASLEDGQLYPASPRSWKYDSHAPPMQIDSPR